MEASGLLKIRTTSEMFTIENLTRLQETESFSHYQGQILLRFEKVLLCLLRNHSACLAL